MNFDLTEEQQMVVDSVARFVANESPVERFRKLRDTERGWEPEVWRRMGEMGWLALGFPEEQGGFGGRFVDMALVLEQLGRGLVPEPYLPSVVLAGGLVSRLGSEAQRERWLAPMFEGSSSLALAYAERQSRYDLHDCRTSAERDGGDFVLRGEKVWVLNGHAADAILVTARTAGGPRERAGIGLFVVEAGSPGLHRLPVHGMDGHHTALLRLEGVRVPAAAPRGRGRSRSSSSAPWPT